MQRDAVNQRLGRHEPAAAGLLRIARDGLIAVRADLQPGGDREARIHRVRQRLKRLRSTLRIVEPHFGERAAAARRELAMAGRLLAKARDADVAAASARGLSASAAGNDHGLGRLALTLDLEAARAHNERTPIGEVQRHLAAATATIAGLEADFDGDALLAAALRRSYADGRRAMRKAKATLATANIHRWRKAVKHLWHVLGIARKRLPRRASRLLPDLDRLGDLLGLDNDHALLAERLALSPSADLSLMDQLSLIARRRHALEEEAFELGDKTYARKPKKFMDRLLPARLLHH
jgi:CHAD domain-containing protein